MQAKFLILPVTQYRPLANMGLMTRNPDGTFNPQGLATRAEVAAIIMRLIER